MISKETLHKYRAAPKTTHSQTHTFNCPRGDIKLRASLHILTFSHQWLSGNLNIHQQNQTIRPTVSTGTDLWWITCLWRFLL